jgi:hypothetical protein
VVERVIERGREREKRRERERVRVCGQRREYALCPPRLLLFIISCHLCHCTYSASSANCTTSASAALS